MDDTSQPQNSSAHVDQPTGEEAPTGAQKSYINTLAEGTGANVEEPATQAEASEKIDQLQDLARATPKDTDIVEGD